MRRPAPGLEKRSPSTSTTAAHGLRVGRSEEEKLLREVSPLLGKLVDRLRKRYGGQALRKVRQLRRMYLEYPTDVLVAAVDDALGFDLYDLDRIERMVLQRIQGDFFRLTPLDSKTNAETDDTAKEDPDDE